MFPPLCRFSESTCIVLGVLQIPASRLRVLGGLRAESCTLDMYLPRISVAPCTVRSLYNGYLKIIG